MGDKVVSIFGKEVPVESLIEDESAEGLKKSCLEALDRMRQRVEEGEVTDLAIVGYKTSPKPLKISVIFSEGSLDRNFIEVMGATEFLRNAALNYCLGTTEFTPLEFDEGEDDD